MARQFGDNGPNRAVRRDSIYGPRTVQEVVASRSEGEHEIAEILGGCLSGNNVADVDVSFGSGPRSNGGHGTRVGLREFATSV